MSKTDKNTKVSVSRAAFLLGFSSMIGQVLLLRELITVFYGNETAYAVILASWLFWVSVGSYAASLFVSRVTRPERFLTASQIVLSGLLPAMIVAVRCATQFLGVQTGEIIGIIPMAAVSFVLLAPLTVLLGILYTFICLLSEREGNDGLATYGIGTVYLWESVGAAIGGVAFTFLLVRILPAMHIAFLTGALNLALGLRIHRRGGRSFAVKGAVVAAAVLALAVGLVGKLDRWTRARQWEGFEVVAVADSIYGNIAITRTGGEYSLYENGLFAFATRDALSSEEGVHFPLLEHPDPKRVLLIGNGMGGGLREVLKHPAAKVDYLELDPTLVEMAARYLPPQGSAPLRDPRVSVVHRDARWFVKQAQGTYDVIIVNLGDPVTALINRYYTLEFFQEARRILASGGILSLSASSSENYLSEEARAFLRSVNTTLSQVFTDVRSIPGDTNIFLACVDGGVLTEDPQVLISRLQARRINAKFVREYYLPYKLSPDRVRYIKGVLERTGAVNTDTRPVAYLYDIVLWSTHFNTAFKDIVARFQQVPFRYLMVLPLIVLAGGWVARRFSSTAPVTLSIVTTGFSEIIFQIVVILAFQTLYGYAYDMIGLIMASFMGGLVLGALLAKRLILKSPLTIPRAYKLAQLAIVIYPALLPMIFIIFRDLSVSPELVGVFATVFAVFPAVAGFIGGLQYPLAIHVVHSCREKAEKGASKTAGALYALDVLGAAVGALLTGMFLVPLYGIFAVAFLCVGINAAVFVLLYPAKLSPRV